MTRVSRSANCTVVTRAQALGKRSRPSEELKKNVNPKLRGLSRRPSCPSASSRPDEREWQALQEMFLASRRKFVGMAYAILRNEEDAEDAVQNACLSAYLHLPAFEGRSALRTWFTRIVLNASFMICRKRKTCQIEFRSECCPSDDRSCMERIPALEPDPEMSCSEGEALQLIDVLLEQMKPKLRQAFTMAYFEEMSTPEACALLGVSTATFKARLFRAKKLLKTQAQRAVAAPHGRPKDSTFFRRVSDAQVLAARAHSSEISHQEIASFRPHHSAVLGTPNAND